MDPVDNLLRSLTFTPGGCWLAAGLPDSQGHVSVLINGRLQPAHVIVYSAEVGPVRTGGHVTQTCGNPTCVNPAHLKIKGN